MIKAGIIGGAGYTAGELIRLIKGHKMISLDFVFSTSNAGNKISVIHQDLIGEIDLYFTDKVNMDVDVVFLCLGHGNSKSFLEKNKFSKKTKIIDLSSDFRLENNKTLGEMSFVYGLPELNKESIKNSNYLANPGCFATAIQLAILPLAQHGLIDDDIHVNAVTGATGAGTSLSKTTHFTWRDNNFSHYKAFNHQHLDEIIQSVKSLQNNFVDELIFIPNRGNFSRGIFATLYTKFSGSLEDAKKMYQEFYKDAVFTLISDNEIHLKQVVNTNKCLIHLSKNGNRILITSVIDNLLKGASGVAIQNMNLMFGFDEAEGLNLKANYF